MIDLKHCCCNYQLFWLLLTNPEYTVRFDSHENSCMKSHGRLVNPTTSEALDQWKIWKVLIRYPDSM